MDGLIHSPFFSGYIYAAGSVTVEAVCGRFVDRAKTTLNVGKVTCVECRSDVLMDDENVTERTTLGALSLPAQFSGPAM